MLGTLRPHEYNHMNIKTLVVRFVYRYGKFNNSVQVLSELEIGWLHGCAGKSKQALDCVLWWGLCEI